MLKLIKNKKRGEIMARARRKTSLLGIIACCIIYVACTKYSEQTGQIISTAAIQVGEWFSDAFTNAVLNK